MGGFIFLAGLGVIRRDCIGNEQLTRRDLGCLGLEDGRRGLHAPSSFALVFIFRFLPSFLGPL